jgi:hypothetical protein
MRTAVFWVITQRLVVILSRRFGKPVFHIWRGPEPRLLKKGPTGCPETSVIPYHYSLRKDPEERISHLLRGRSLKTREMKLVKRSEEAKWKCCKLHWIVSEENVVINILNEYFVIRAQTAGLTMVLFACLTTHQSGRVTGSGWSSVSFTLQLTFPWERRPLCAQWAVDSTEEKNRVAFRYRSTVNHIGLYLPDCTMCMTRGVH